LHFLITQVLRKTNIRLTNYDDKGDEMRKWDDLAVWNYIEEMMRAPEYSASYQEGYWYAADDIAALAKRVLLLLEILEVRYAIDYGEPELKVVDELEALARRRSDGRL